MNTKHDAFEYLANPAEPEPTEQDAVRTVLASQVSELRERNAELRFALSEYVGMHTQEELDAVPADSILGICRDALAKGGCNG